MASTLSPSIQAEFSKDGRPTEPSRPVDFDLNHGQFSRTRPSLGKRASRTLARFLITFCIGVAATLAWQSYGDTAREMIANSYPQLGWLAPQAAPLAQTAPNTVAPAAPAALSPEVPQLKAMAASLAAVRQSVDQLAAGQQQMVGDIANLRAAVAAGQQQMVGDIANLQAADQDILHKISAPPPRPAAPPARKPVPQTPPPSSEAPPVR
jgi:hypothetical protein